MTNLELFSLMVTTAALFGWISRRWFRLPLTIGTMLLTVVASLALVAASHFYPGLKPWAEKLVGAINFENLILHGMLSVLLFAGAFLLDLDALFKEKRPYCPALRRRNRGFDADHRRVLFFVLPLLGLHASWLECLLFGALISPTDPIAVLEMLKRRRRPRRTSRRSSPASRCSTTASAPSSFLPCSKPHAELLPHLPLLRHVAASRPAGGSRWDSARLDDLAADALDQRLPGRDVC